MHIAQSIVANLGLGTVQATAILIAAAAILAVWRNASAARRHTVWLAALIACGVAALVSPLLPNAIVRFSAPATVMTVARAVGIETAPATQSIPRPLAQTSATLENIAHLQGSGVSPRVPAAPVGLDSAPKHDGWPTIIMLVTLLWICGVIGVLLRVIAGSISVARVARRLRRLDDPRWLAELRTVAASLQVSRNVSLVWSETSTTPVTFGIRRPTIAIPIDARQWTAEQRRVVLLHEVAHVARGDIAAQLLANVIGALLWFHPLIWLARRQLRAEAESAADDCVLSAGVPASTYADQLLGFARASSLLSIPATVSLGMFSNSDLERRFATMLDTTRSRASTSRGIRRAAAAFALVGGTGVAGMRFATTPLPPVTKRQIASVPNLSGMWTDGQTPPSLVITIAQTDSTIWISERGNIFFNLLATPSLEAWGGPYRTRNPQQSALIHLDGTKGEETVSLAPPMIVTNTITGAWDGREFVTTSSQTVPEDGGWFWKRIDRWSLTSDSTLNCKVSILIPAHGKQMEPSTEYGTKRFVKVQ
ncbi:MAG TPA: M56 family metallopeptidase [Gemmatimonadaceae bacterium]|jgi:beta-lactamase regulating signal transducer with metallopeptidase domain